MTILFIPNTFVLFKTHFEIRLHKVKKDTPFYKVTCPRRLLNVFFIGLPKACLIRSIN